MAVQQGLLYTKDHEWAKVEGDTVTVGITDYAQEQLGEIVFVEPPKVGKDFGVHKEMAVVESSKAASDVYCPVAGKVTEINAELETKPELDQRRLLRQGMDLQAQDRGQEVAPESDGCEEVRGIPEDALIRVMGAMLTLA